MATYIIAEAGVNHNGDVALAKRLVEAAAKAGADAVKFQTFKANELATAQAPKAPYQIRNDGSGNQVDMLQCLELTYSEHEEIAGHCKKCNIEFLSTAFGLSELDFLIDLGMSAVKVPSGEITNLPLLEKMAEVSQIHELPVYLSTGMSTLSEIELALDIFVSSGVKRKDIVLLHCLSTYPAPEDEVNLNAMKTLESAFKCNVGYSDHTLGTTAAVAAVALGAIVIEKHITLNTNMIGPDHKASLEPKEFEEMVVSIRSCESMLGDGIKRPQESELNTRRVARRSIRAARRIEQGQVITVDDIACQRPGDGVSPMRYREILFKNASKVYLKGDALNE